jgi:hypothetical protein
MTIDQVNKAIMFGNFTNDQLNSITMALKFARAQLTKETKRSLSVGLPVKFVSSRDGRTVLGTVTKINRKFVIVKEQNSNSLFPTNWRVPANMLETA